MAETSRTAAERSLQASLAANTRWSREDPRSPDAAPARARAGLAAKFLREVDPEGVLPEDERARRAECARRAYYQRLSLSAAQARRARRFGNGMSPDAA